MFKKTVVDTLRPAPIFFICALFGMGLVRYLRGHLDPLSLVRDTVLMTVIAFLLLLVWEYVRFRRKASKIVDAVVKYALSRETLPLSSDEDEEEWDEDEPEGDW